MGVTVSNARTPSIHGNLPDRLLLALSCKMILLLPYPTADARDGKLFFTVKCGFSRFFSECLSD